jgi:hypothetical protein
MSSKDLPFVKRRINELTLEDNKVQIIGKVIKKIGETEFKLNDETGEISVIFSEADPIIKKLKEDMIVKVLGEIQGDSIDIINATFIKDFSGLNFELFKKTHELKKKFFES